MKGFYKQFFSMYVLLVLQNVVTISVNLADNMMLGAYGEIALSGVAAVNQIQFVFQQILVALGEGVVILASQYWGKKEAGPAGNILAASLRFAAAVVIYMAKKGGGLPFRLDAYKKTSKTMTGDYRKVILPLLVTQGLWGINTALQTAVLGHMDAAALAANSAASTLFLLVKSGAVGAAGAASVLIGTTIGSGQLDLVKLYARKLQKIFVGIGIVSGVTLFFLRIPVLSMYRLGESAMAYANAFLMVLSVVCAGMSYQMPVNAGIIKGGGNTGFVLKMDLVSIWCIVVPLSLVMAFVVKASPVVVVCCLNADQVFKCIPAFIMVNYGNWIRKLTRDSETQNYVQGS